ADVILGGSGNDTITANLGEVYVQGGTSTLLDGNNIVLGDNGFIDWTRAERSTTDVGADTDPTGIDMIQSTDLTYAGNDTVRTGASDDIIIGGSGNDMIDGGLGRDLIFGDNVTLNRTNTLANPRFRALSGTQIYDTSANTTAGAALVTTVPQVDPHASTFWGNFQISLIDSNAGNDYIAGGGGDDEIFGQGGNDVIQGDGSIDITFASQLPAGLLANWQDSTSAIAAGTVGASNTDFRSLVGAGRDLLNNLSVHASVDNYKGAG